MIGPFAMDLWWLAQAAPDPTSALPAWLTGTGLAAVLGWLLYRAEHARSELEKRHDAAMAAERMRLDACEERSRTILREATERTWEAVAALGKATDLIQAFADRDRR